MLKILFSPSEGKKSGGILTNTDIFATLKSRDIILYEYNKIILSGNEDDIKSLFGFKKFSECKPYICDIFNSELMPAIERYQGVAYDYLNYQNLNKAEQTYLKENTLIFSNLYGPLLGGDLIANYKVKQGNTIGDIYPDKFYKERFTYQLDLYLSSSDVLDLRAGYYDKFYKPSKQYTTLKFLKNKKVVSHWAKAYRGLVLREIAKNNIRTLDDFMKLEIDTLTVEEIKILKNKTEIVYNIVD